MKKFFLSHWESICFAVVFLLFSIILLEIYLFTFTSLLTTISTTIASVVYAVVIFICIIRKLTFRRFAHLIQSILIAIISVLEMQGDLRLADWSVLVLTILTYVFIGFTIARISIWLFKKWQTRRKPKLQG